MHKNVPKEKRQQTLRKDDQQRNCGNLFSEKVLKYAVSYKCQYHKDTRILCSTISNKHLHFIHLLHFIFYLLSQYNYVIYYSTAQCKCQACFTFKFLALYF